MTGVALSEVKVFVSDRCILFVHGITLSGNIAATKQKDTSNKRGICFEPSMIMTTTGQCLHEDFLFHMIDRCY